MWMDAWTFARLAADCCRPSVPHHGTEKTIDGIKHIQHIQVSSLRLFLEQRATHELHPGHR